MDSAQIVRVTALERRRSLRRITFSTALWTLGSALAAGPLLLYFGTQQWVTVSFREIVLLLIALAGLLRLATPYLIRWRNSLQQVAIGGMGFAALIVAIMPLFYRDGSFAEEETAIKLHAALFALAAACDAIAGVALWLWIGQLCPRRFLGKYLGRREAWRAAAALFGVAAVVAVNWLWRQERMSGLEKLAKLAPCVWLGAFCCLFAAIWLLPARDFQWRDWSGKALRWSGFRPNDVHFRLLLFACWSAFFAALMVPAQNYFPRFTLELTWVAPLALLGITLLGQAMASFALGKRCDGLGSLPVMLISQIVCSLAPICFLLATPERPWSIGAAALVQVAQIGVLLGVYRLMLRGSSLAEQMHFVPLLLAAAALCAGVGRVGGELMLEALSYHHFQVAVGELDDYGYLFYIGGITNLLGIMLLFGWHEEGRQSLADWLRTTKRKWFPAKETTAVPIKHPLD